jgi:RNA polymerase primary sigma factor
MERLLTLLNEREKDVVKRFFGIGYEYSFTLEDIATDLKLTRERVRQIKENALKKLNFEANMKLLKPYLCAC